MRAITLHQPWASAIAVGLKTIETRGWSTAYRGSLVIHAAAKGGRELKRLFETMAPEDRTAFAAAGIRAWHELPLMRPVAVADLVGVWSLPTAFDFRATTPTELRWGIYGPGRFAWLLENIRPVVRPWPVAVTGYQGLWHWRHGDLDAHLGAPLHGSTPSASTPSGSSLPAPCSLLS